MSAKRALRRVHAPDELGAEQRAWTVVRSAYADRDPVPARRSWRRLAVLPAVALLAAGVALSPAGATVGRWIGHTLGIQHAAPALFSLPAPGAVLVSGPGGTWTIAADGSSRRLGSWQHASWSPHGLFITVTTHNELAAVDPHGTPRWTLARPAVSDPTWYPPTGLRIAYLSGHDLRSVAGDGTGDHLLATDVPHIAPAWRPDHPFQLAYLNHAGQVVVRQADTGQVTWTVKPQGRPRALAWSARGTRLLVITRTRALVYGPTAKLTAAITTSPATPIFAGSLSPDGQMLALLRGGASEDVSIANLTTRRPHLKRVLTGDGLRQLAWSPNGQWLLITWPVADQWVFVRVTGRPRIAAVSHIARQITGNSAEHAFPRIDGWCCTPQGAAG